MIRHPASSSFTDSPWLHRWFFILHSFTKKKRRKKKKGKKNTIFILGEIISTVHLNQPWNRFIYEELSAQRHLCCCGRQNKKNQQQKMSAVIHFVTEHRYWRNAIKWAWTGSVFFFFFFVFFFKDSIVELKYQTGDKIRAVVWSQSCWCRHIVPFDESCDPLPVMFASLVSFSSGSKTCSFFCQRVTIQRENFGIR